MSMDSKFELVLFSTNPGFIREAVAAGVDAIIVDWENIGKVRRQAFADTQINCDTIRDLRGVRGSTDNLVICRVNNCGSATAKEVEKAIETRADEILIPMVRSVEEVVRIIDQVEGRCGVGILVETRLAVELAEELGRLPLSRAYVGLNDLAIERGTPNIFTALVDGTVERVRKAFRVPFGFGGLTLPDRGYPIPCRLLIGELARLKCDFSFLRRSFYRDIRGREMAREIPRLRQALQEAWRRTPEEVARDCRELDEAVWLRGGELTRTMEFSIDG
jgi:hypothetical protein